MTARLTFSFVLLTLLASAATARADEPVTLYPAPLSQTVQTTYVPQSVAMSGPEEIDAEEGRRAPSGYTPVQRTRKGLLIGGIATLGGGYLYSALGAAVIDDVSSIDGERHGTSPLWIPVVGPFLEMGETDSSTGRLFLGVLGAAQVTGAVMLYYGLTTTKTVYVRNDLVGPIAVAPLIGNGNAGLAFSGSF